MRQSLARIRPRPDQIAELTRGLDLPLPEVDPVHIQILAEGFIRAFDDIHEQWPVTVEGAEEPEITALLESRLLRMIEEDLFWRQLVLFVVRGRESHSFDSSHLEKCPDLSICLSNRTRRFPLVAEAKILHKAADKTITDYCKDGVRRFVDGEYAWGTQEAIMIAYVRDGSSIDSTLTPFLSKAMQQIPPGYLVEQLPVRVEGGVPNLARSRHGRVFTYIHKEPPMHQPGSITVWHLWLS